MRLRRCGGGVGCEAGAGAVAAGGGFGCGADECGCGGECGGRERAGRGRGRPDRGPHLAEPPWAGPVREKRDLSFFNFYCSYMYLIVIILT